MVHGRQAEEVKIDCPQCDELFFNKDRLAKHMNGKKEYESMRV